MPGGKIVFYRSVRKACLVFPNPNCPILKTTFHRLQLRIMFGPAGIRLQSVLSGCPAGRKFSCPVHLYYIPLITLPQSLEAPSEQLSWGVDSCFTDVPTQIPMNKQTNMFRSFQTLPDRSVSTRKTDATTTSLSPVKRWSGTSKRASSSRLASTTTTSTAQVSR